MAVFENPINGYKETIPPQGAILWTMLLGGIYLAALELWGPFVIWFLIVPAATALAAQFGLLPGLIVWFGFALCFSINLEELLEKKYLRRGWRKIDVPAEKKVVQEAKTSEEDYACSGLARALFGPGLSDAPKDDQEKSS